MSSSPADITLMQRVRVMQIITAALAMGIVSFMVVAIIIGPTAPPPPMPLITYVSLGFAVVMLVLQTVIPDMLAGGSKGKDAGRLEGLAESSTPRDVGRLCDTYQTRLIIAAALLEGGTFFALVAYLLHANVLALIAAVVLLAVLLAKFPTTARVEHWVESQRDGMR